MNSPCQQSTVVSAETPQRNWKKIAPRVLVSCALLAVLIWRTPLTQIGAILRGVPLGALLVASAIALGGWWLSGLRLWCLLPEFRARELVRATFIALFHSTVLPGQLAGDAIKAYRLGRLSGRPGHAEAATLVDRVIAVFAMFAIGAVAALHSESFPSLLRLFFVAGTVAIAVGAAIIAARPFRRMLERTTWIGNGRVGTFARHFALALHECLRQPPRMLASFALALLFHASCVVTHVVLGHALRLPLAWPDWAAVYAGASLVALLPVSIAGLGVRESGYVGMLALFGVAAGAGLALSFIVLGLMLVGAACGALLELTRPAQPPQSEGAAR